MQSGPCLRATEPEALQKWLGATPRRLLPPVERRDMSLVCIVFVSGKNYGRVEASKQMLGIY